MDPGAPKIEQAPDQTKRPEPAVIFTSRLSGRGHIRQRFSEDCEHIEATSDAAEAADTVNNPSQTNETPPSGYQSSLEVKALCPQ